MKVSSLLLLLCFCFSLFFQSSHSLQSAERLVFGQSASSSYASRYSGGRFLCCVLVISLGLKVSAMQYCWAQRLCLFAAAITEASSFTNLNSNGRDCIDPSGFLKCYAAQEHETVVCINDWAPKYCQSKTSRHNCMKSCFSRQNVGNIGCWLQSCWNQVSFLSCSLKCVAVLIILF